jgi:membrane associated rhomboid family serine protease
MIPIHDDNPTHIRPYVTWTIIGLCVAIFLWQFSLDSTAATKVIYALGVVPAVILGDKVLPAEITLVPGMITVITSMFMHGGWMHLIGNMLFLWVFGNNIEDAMGHFKFIVFYGLCGLAAAGGQIASDPASTIPMIGASGAISGVLGAYLLLYPRARVLMLVWLGFFVTTFRIPAVIVLGGWIALQFYSAAASDGGGGGVAWWAHIGGFAAGLVLIPLFRYRHVPFFGHGSESHNKKIFEIKMPNSNRTPAHDRTRPPTVERKAPWAGNRKPGPWGRR